MMHYIVKGLYVFKHNYSVIANQCLFYSNLLSSIFFRLLPKQSTQSQLLSIIWPIKAGELLINQTASRVQLK